MGDPATIPQAIAHPNRLKSWAYMVNDRLFPAVLRVRRFLLDMPDVLDGRSAQGQKRNRKPRADHAWRCTLI